LSRTGHFPKTARNREEHSNIVVAQSLPAVPPLLEGRRGQVTESGNLIHYLPKNSSRFVFSLAVLMIPPFKRAYKKMHANQKKAVNDAAAVIVVNSSVGELKKGDLAGVYVYKFQSWPKNSVYNLEKVS